MFSKLFKKKKEVTKSTQKYSPSLKEKTELINGIEECLRQDFLYNNSPKFMKDEIIYINSEKNRSCGYGPLYFTNYEQSFPKVKVKNIFVDTIRVWNIIHNYVSDLYDKDFKDKAYQYVHENTEKLLSLITFEYELEHLDTNHLPKYKSIIEELLTRETRELVEKRSICWENIKLQEKIETNKNRLNTI